MRIQKLDENSRKESFRRSAKEQPEPIMDSMSRRVAEILRKC